jgi:hypothetical protein
VGTIFARSLHGAWTALKSTVSKKQMANGVIEALKKTRMELVRMSSSILPDPQDRDELVYPEIYEYDGKVVGSFLRAFILSAPADWKAELCIKFKENFGTEGFPTVARTGVCD